MDHVYFEFIMFESFIIHIVFGLVNIVEYLLFTHPNTMREYEISLGTVWNPESTKERNKNTKENDFLMFVFSEKYKRK